MLTINATSPPTRGRTRTFYRGTDLAGVSCLEVFFSDMILTLLFDGWEGNGVDCSMIDQCDLREACPGKFLLFFIINEKKYFQKALNASIPRRGPNAS